MKVNQHKALWEKIQAFPLDDPQADVTFSQKLATQQGWSRRFTERAITEYKRFIFLCCIPPTGASPPPIVDEVWHLHLTYTTNYWKAFCGDCLQQEIHHHPSKGGQTEKQKHNDWYATTLTIYQDVFEESPPSDIWPTLSSEPTPKFLPRLRYSDLYPKRAWLITLPFLFPLMMGKLHPFALNGSLFLLFYGLLIIAAFRVLFLAKGEKQNRIEVALQQTDIADANVFQMARFIWGNRKAIETAVVDLVAKEILVTERDGLLRFQPSRSTPEDELTNPVLPGLLNHYKNGDLLKLTHIHEHYNTQMNHHSGLEQLLQLIDNNDGWRHTITVFVIGTGIVRFIQGTYNNMPVAYLTIMLITAAFLLVPYSNSLSPANLLRERIKAIYQNGKEYASPAESQLTQFMLFGLPTLTTAYPFLYLDKVFQQHTSMQSGGFGGDAGCGSSGCGSSCSSGCGGCGGGD